MGTIGIDEGRKLKTVDHKVYLVETFTDTFSACHPEEGYVWCNLGPPGSKEPTHHLTVCSADWNETWYEKWLAAFAAIPAYREQFLFSEGRDWVQHPTIPTDLPHVGFVEIDELLAPAVRKLNAIGCRTTGSCQGTESKNGVPFSGPDGSADVPCAYISLDTAGESFPSELLHAWSAAGMQVSPHSVYANAPHGLHSVAAVHLIESLRDWLAGTLDETGSRYRLREKRRSSLPVIPALPQVVLESKQAKAIKVLIRLGNKARFRDYAALKSGTDKWSKMRLPALREAMGDTFSAVTESGLDEEQQARLARWILRGLPADMALRKVRTDLEIASNAR